MSNVISVLSVSLFLVCWFLIIKKLIGSKYAPVKTVHAEVFDKYKPHTVSNYPGTCKQEYGIVVFQTKGKKLSFYVSEFSYGNYKLKEKGTLKYQGNRIISFQ